MKLNKSKILIVLVLAVFLFSLFGSFTFAAERELEVEYPKLDGEEITATTTLPEYVKYIFKFSLIIAAVAAFAILIYGGFRYLTSAGAPETMREAKSWMFGGILGLVLLLCSYLILTTINPELLSPKEPKVEAIAGIFLLNDKGRRLYYNEDIPEIPEGFKAEKYAIEFISNKPQQEYKTTPKKELISVFYYRDKNWEGEVKEIKNPKKPDDLFVTRLLDFFPKSIHFLWNEPGVYLFEKESHETPAPPELYKASAENLGDFDDKAKSVVTTEPLEIVGTPSREGLYGAIYFTETNFVGKCDFVFHTVDSFREGIRGDISSIAVVKVTKEYEHGEVIFYDAQNCEGRSYTWTPSSDEPVPYLVIFSGTNFDKVNPADPDKSLENNVESFKINGNFSVLLSAEGGIKLNRCQLFTGIHCHSSLKGKYVYSAAPVSEGGHRPQVAYIFPVPD